MEWNGKYLDKYCSTFISCFEIKHNKHHIWIFEISRKPATLHHNLEVGVFKLAREMEREEEEEEEEKEL